jgi:hypothetical protein
MILNKAGARRVDQLRRERGQPGIPIRHGNCLGKVCVRVVSMHKPSSTVMRQITIIPPAQMSCREIQTLYRRR